MKIGWGLLPMATVTYAFCVWADEDRIRQAVQKAIPLIEKSAATYVQKRDCFTCHHQALPLMVFSRVKSAGFQVGDDSISKQVHFSLEYFNDRLHRLPMGQGVPGGSYTAGYALTGLSEAKVTGDETTKALVSYLLKIQNKDGSWRIRTHRPPLEDSHFTATALALRGLVEFGDGEKIADSINSALAWLNKTQPRSGEDHAFKVLGLHWAGADKSSAAEALLQLQREDQGWAQLPGMKSDAYATGQVLATLRRSGFLKPSSPQYKAGIQWLLGHQQPDGSWHVKTRSKPIQKYFESGFPHGKDQFISISATCWAVMALLPPS